MWSDFREIYRDRKFWLVALLIIFLWVILINVVTIAGDGDFHLPGSDGYVILMQAGSWYEGHPTRLQKFDTESAGTSDYLYPVILSLGHWLGFRSKGSFILWSYILNLFLYMGFALFMYRFFKRFFPDVAFISAIFSVIFAPIYFNFFLCTNFSLFMFLLFGALAFLGSLPFFLLFAILASLSRPEGILAYLFLTSIYLWQNGKEDWWKLAPGILPFFLVPGIINLTLTGQFFHQGAVSQSLFQYDSLMTTFRVGALNVMDHIKGSILGLFKTGERFGLSRKGNGLFTLPPFLFIISLIGTFFEENKKIAIPSLIFFLILILGDSVAVFTGVQYNRHILPVIPILFAISFTTLKTIDSKINYVFPAFLIFFSLFFVTQEVIIIGDIHIKIEHRKRNKEVSRWLEDNIRKGEEIFNATVGNKSIPYWNDDYHWIHLTPNLNPELGRNINSFWKSTETTELVQRYYSDVKYLLWDKSSGYILNWFGQFTSDSLRKFTWIGKEHEIHLYTVDMRVLSDKRFTENIIDKLDVGDPASEKLHNFKRVNISGMELTHNIHSVDGIYDGARVTEGYESWVFNAPSESSKLVCLLSNKFTGRKMSFSREQVDFTLGDAKYKISINNKLINSGKIKGGPQLVEVTIPEYFNNNTLNVKITGRFVSYHYWLIKE